MKKPEINSRTSTPPQCADRRSTPVDADKKLPINTTDHPGAKEREQFLKEVDRVVDKGRLRKNSERS